LGPEFGPAEDPMEGWSPEEVAELDDRESHFSHESNRVETAEYILFLVPGSYALTYVRRFRSERARAEAAIDDVLERVRKSGGTGLRWVVNPSSFPDDLADRLLARGFSKFAAAETLFFELGTKATPRLPRARPRATVSVREVFTDSDISAFVRLGEAIFGDPRPPPAYLEKFRAEVRRHVRETGRSELFLSFEGETPVGRGGMSVTGSIGRLWTSGVLAEHRGKGAYMVLTRERCKSALEQGAQIALTHAKVETSAPILKAHGFRSAGPYDYYELRFG
jgi:hypothetical protein